MVSRFFALLGALLVTSCAFAQPDPNAPVDDPVRPPISVGKADFQTPPPAVLPADLPATSGKGPVEDLKQAIKVTVNCPCPPQEKQAAIRRYAGQARSRIQGMKFISARSKSIGLRGISSLITASEGRIISAINRATRQAGQHVINVLRPEITAVNQKVDTVIGTVDSLGTAVTGMSQKLDTLMERSGGIPAPEAEASTPLGEEEPAPVQSVEGDNALSIIAQIAGIALAVFLICFVIYRVVTARRHSAALKGERVSKGSGNYIPPADSAVKVEFVDGVVVEEE